MKKVLIMVISSELHPYDKMITNSMTSWDSVHVDGVETLFYCGKSNKQNSEKILYTSLEEGLYNMGYKDLEAFEWVLKNKEFDYVARVNSSCYVDKKNLLAHVQSLPSTDLFAGAIVDVVPRWMAGLGQFVISRDVLQKIVDNKEQWDHTKIEDMAISQLIDSIGIPYTGAKACTINKRDNDYLCLFYGGGDSFETTNLKELEFTDHFFFRVKTEGDRDYDKVLMNKLFEIFN